MQKIETVGKTYMSAGGLKSIDKMLKQSHIHPVKRAIGLAFEMQNCVK